MKSQSTSYIEGARYDGSEPDSNQNHVRMWDNWYCPVPADDFEGLRAAHGSDPRVGPLFASSSCFLVGYLNARREFFDGDLGPNQHHFNSRLGTALTQDFVSYIKLTDQALVATESEGSIWSGTLTRGPVTAGGARSYLFFYTCRDIGSPFGLSQEIRLSHSTDLMRFDRLPLRVVADTRWFDSHSLPNDTTVHAFRDPYPVRVGDETFLLISAKSRFLTHGQIGKVVGGNGVIAFYRLNTADGGMLCEGTSLCFSAGKPEMEMASLYWDARHGEHLLCYSSHSDEDYLKRPADVRGLPEGRSDEKGIFYEAPIRNLAELLKNPPLLPVELSPRVVEGCAPNSYANRYVPEKGGIILGFDLMTGMPVCGTSARPELRSMLAEFSSSIPF